MHGAAGERLMGDIQAVSPGRRVAVVFFFLQGTRGMKEFGHEPLGNAQRNRGKAS